MAAAILDLDDTRVIEQGSYWEVLINYPGNVTNFFLKGQIRPGFDGNLLAEFRFDGGVYNSELNQTTFRMYLSAAQTKKLTPAPSDSPHRYDVLLYGANGEPVRILQGVAVVSPGVTE